LIAIILTGEGVVVRQYTYFEPVHTFNENYRKFSR